MMRTWCIGLALVAAFVAGTGAQVPTLPAPRTIDTLRELDVTPNRLRVVRTLPDGRGYRARLVSYRSGDLTLYAFVATPAGSVPRGGFPVLVANHGTHPNPPRYGFTADGVDARPGDYYRPVPELFAGHGFLVVMPDYRGHNSSEGGEFAHGFLASAYYTEDVLALLPALGDLERADVDNIFMWGHSLGGEITLRALLATTRVKGASLWSTVGGDIWEQAYYYARVKTRTDLDGSDVAHPHVETLRADIAALGASYDWAAREPLRHLERLRTPLMLHHAVDDVGARFEWSERLSAALVREGHRYTFSAYAGSDHFFKDRDRQLAADRDVAFFRSLMAAGDRR
jgi:dipeptidyl aminopeptidase/acylaminoacyl peptidase